MSKFKVGDIIIAKEHNGYGITNKEVMGRAKVINTDDDNYDDIKIKILDVVDVKNDKGYVGSEWWVSSKHFDICPDNYYAKIDYSKYSKKELLKEIDSIIEQSVSDYNDLVKQLVKVRHLVNKALLKNDYYFRNENVREVFKEIAKAIEVGEEGHLTDGEIYKVIDTF